MKVMGMAAHSELVNLSPSFSECFPGAQPEFIKEIIFHFTLQQTAEQSLI